MSSRPSVISSAIKPPVVRKPRVSKTGKIFIFVFLIVVFEGAFRKWVSASLTNPLVLLRDVSVLYCILLAIQARRFQFTRVPAQLLLIWTAFVVIWGLLQLIVGQSSLSIFLIGCRFWLLYLWFAYAVAVSLTEYDFYYITKTTLLLMLAMAPLAVVQFLLPPGAFLNQQVGGDESTVFRVTADIVRTTGTFSFTAGYSTFLAFVTPFVFALLTPGNRIWQKEWMTLVCWLALGVATIVSGSRTAIIYYGLSLLVFGVSSFFFSRTTRKFSSVVMIATVIAMLASILVSFSRAVDALQERFVSAAEVEVFSERVSSILFGESHAYSRVTFVGHGIGMGTNAASVITTGERAFMLAETEVARVVLEGGFLGFVFIGIKLLVTAVGIRKALGIARTTGNALPLLLWFTTSLALFSWSIIGQLTINALGYMALGLAIASLRLNQRRGQ